MEPYCFVIIKTELNWPPLKQGAFLLESIINQNRELTTKAKDMLQISNLGTGD